MLNKFFIAALLLAATAFWTPSQAQMFTEVEPNDPCVAAQNIGPAGPLAVVEGGLDSTESFLDIDYFRFDLPPGDSVQVDLEGGSTGAGTLGDPLLGAFDSACLQIAVDDDGGVGANSRLFLFVPADGVLVIAATQFPDFGFTGGGNGSYLLTLSPIQAIDSISGRFINGGNGDPLPETSPAFVQLLRCQSVSECYEFVAFQQADPLGEFFFNQDYNGNALLAGFYQLAASASGFEYYVGEPFEVLEGEARNLGDLGLVPLSLIGSISGRLVSASDGSPVPGTAPPFAGVILERCDGEYCYGIASAGPDDQGAFRIEGGIYLIAPGTFRLRAYADGFRQATSGRFEVGESADVDVGDFALTPFPIQVLNVTPCEIPAAGGVCNYSFQIRNRDNKRYRGEAWSSVEVYGPPTYDVTRFQVGKVGTANPMPVRLNLKAGQEQALNFALPVPGVVPADTYVCAFLTVGRYPAPQFNNDGTRHGFCALKHPAGFELLSDKETRIQLRRLRAATAR